MHNPTKFSLAPRSSRRPRFRNRARSINTARWAAYATAGVASALAGANSAEADITYSGPINEPFSAAVGGSILKNFQLTGAGNSFDLQHIRRPNNGSAAFGIYAAVSAAFAGFTAAFGTMSYGYVSKLNFGANIATRPFAGGLPGYLAVNSGFGNANSQWLAAGTGYIGFKFNDGAGTRYGWVRITMNGAPINSFTLDDYAFAGVGENITAGQVPEPGSLGLLALGGVGLIAWRKRRATAPR